LHQRHPTAAFQSASGGAGTSILPILSDVAVRLNYQPVELGLSSQRTYSVNFAGHYTFLNYSTVTQTIRVDFCIPGEDALLDHVNFTLGAGDRARRSIAAPVSGVMSAFAEVAPGENLPVTISYDCRGMDSWQYVFGDSSRIRDFTLNVITDFHEANFPISSPFSRETQDKGETLQWKYVDAISPPDVAIDMPDELNAGPVVASIALYSPLSLLLFFGVLTVVVIARGIPLHPVNYAFVAAGYFAFPLLFSYTVDVLPVHLSFIVPAGVAVALVCGYLRAVPGVFLFRVALTAQMVYMTLFSYSFFFRGYTGLTLTLGGVATLAALMHFTARVSWNEKLGGLTLKPA
jgi:hypothetical protein